MRLRTLLVPTQQRAYVAAHPLAVWFALGVAVTGVINLIAPHLTAESASTVVLGSLLVKAFNATWFLGGSLSVVGILRGKRRFEAAGMSLLAGGFASYYILIGSLVPYAWITGFFIIALAIGCAIRAYRVTRTGYVNVEVAHSDV